ncbi:MrcB family domain-containing protein [Halobacillus naozhouensis]|uniref:DUF3578 domain-containing protein n=1 Tax=Halobacillus naozhouensis TaxID=554880 RepID=A0ABY8J468_9BACI|nr:DUF3578 domain-containing protein [Halobacillus naozhouensis]WFT76223.1 DUF3578 domain-containing protein [Halobacillus naozhouensis]
MREKLIEVMEDYQEFYYTSRTPSTHRVGKNLGVELPRVIASQLSLDDNKYMVTGSYGAGNLTTTPWVAIFDRNITDSAQRGFYIVIIFCSDMSGFYLSLNQGTKYLQTKFKGNKPKEKMAYVARYLRDSLELPQERFPLTSIELKSHTQNAKNYEAANICAKYYGIDDSFDNEQLRTDIRALLAGLDKIKHFMGIKSLDQVIDDIIYDEEIEDTKFQEDISITEADNTPEEPQTPPRTSSRFNSAAYNRNPAKAKEALEKANHRCEFDSTHITFLSSRTGENFVEAHHLVPMERQIDFTYSLDVPGNIVALCPNCHRCIHHGTKRQKNGMLKELFNIRKGKLAKFGIDVDLAQLASYYIMKSHA